MAAIEDYALVGDCRGAALISRDGSVDWLVWPRFDSAGLFAAVLDETKGGRWSIAPRAPYRATRRYFDGSNVLETRFRTATGELSLIDSMPIREGPAPDYELLRRVTCIEGEVEVEVTFDPRPDFARAPAHWTNAGPLGRCAETRAGLLRLSSERPLTVGACERFRLRARESLRLSLSLSPEAPAILPLLGRVADEAIARSVRWWRDWAKGLRYHGPHRAAVERSALALRLLFFAPSGAVVAAPTTSLPERPGGNLNWDYRYCWLRDASLTVRALYGLGFSSEAQAFVCWLLYTTGLSHPGLRTLYDVYGNRPPREHTLDSLRGFGGARPVRIGNAAVDQLQLDIYGEVIDAAAQLARRGARLDRETRKMLRRFGREVCRRWREPDEGIWEPRSGRAHHTHSLLLSWVALDRLLELADRGQLTRIPVDELRRQQRLIRDQIETRAWNPRLRSYVATLDGDQLDGSLLLLGWYGFEPPDSGRMRSTYDAIAERLRAAPGLYYRYSSTGEGAFGIVGFWAVECLALTGRLEEAHAEMDALCAHANDVGLFAEEIDALTGAHLGNFPQAFTHVGLINAALTLERCTQQPRKPPPAPSPSSERRPHELL